MEKGTKEQNRTVPLETKEKKDKSKESDPVTDTSIHSEDMRYSHADDLYE
ncbi:MAG TPA: hypothetical protein VIG80_02380 [Bacillaceae bacterium]